MPLNKHLEIFYWNARSVASKQIELQYHIETGKFDVIVICETWLKPKVKFYLKNYIIHRCDRENAPGGGVAIAIRSGIIHKLLPSLKTPSIENIAVTVATTMGDLTIIGAYSPKHTTSFIEDVRKLMHRSRHYFIIGDLNARHTSWNCVSNNKAGLELYTTINSSTGYIIAPTTPTFYPPNGNASVLDIIITNSCIRISHPTPMQILNSDHLPVKFQIGTIMEIEDNSFRRCFKKANWAQYKHSIATQVDGLEYELNTEEDINRLIEKTNEIIRHACDRSIPMKRINLHIVELDEATKKMIAERNRLRRSWQRSRDPSTKSFINLLSKLIAEKIQMLKNKFWDKKLQDFKVGQKSFWKLAKRMRGTTTSVKHLKINGDVLVDPVDKANALADTFEQAHKTTATMAHQHDRLVSEKMNTLSARHEQEIHLTNAIEVKNTIRTTRPFKAGGKDGIINALLKNLPRQGLTLLTDIFNGCIQQAYYPAKWKEAVITAIPKPNKDPTNPSSYRPISLLNSIGKIFERIILIRVNLQIEQTNAMREEQFGFRTGHSSSSQLLRVLSKAKANLTIHSRKSTGLVLLDIEKAFDTVWHQGLLYKLLTYGFQPHLVLLIKSFLEDRSFTVRVNTQLSTKRQVPAGVPQGSCISPILYNLYTADIPNIPGCELALYADDTAIYTASRIPNAICNRLQKGLDTITEYFSRWRIKIQHTKTQCIFIAQNNRHRTAPTREIRINDAYCPWRNEANYLGILIDKKLLFGKHIENITRKAYKALMALYPLINRRSKLSRKNKMLIYTGIIRPILTYGAPVWYNAAECHHKQMQILQNKCLKIIWNLHWRHPTRNLKEVTDVPLLKDYLTATIAKFQRNCSHSEFETIRTLGSIHIVDSLN